MSYRTDETRPGIRIFHLSKALTKLEVTNLVQDVEKGLGQGKIKVIVEFSRETATGPLGFGYVQNAFLKLQTLAQKMRGSILYVLPPKIAGRVEGTYPDLALAIQVISSAGASSDDRSKLVEDLKKQVLEQTAQLEKMSVALEALAKKNKELADLISQPLTAPELKAAVEHYRNLASEAQILSPNSRVK